MLTSGSSSRSGDGLGRRGSPATKRRRVGLHLHEPHGPLAGARVGHEAALRVDHGRHEGRVEAVADRLLADGLLVLERVPEARVPARHLLVHLVPGRRRPPRGPRARRPARPRAGGGGAAGRAPAAAAPPSGPRGGRSVSRIGASQGRPAYSAKRSATQARRASRPPSFTSTRSARAAFSSSGAGGRCGRRSPGRAPRPARGARRPARSPAGRRRTGPRRPPRTAAAPRTPAAAGAAGARPARRSMPRRAPRPAGGEPLEVGDPALLGERARPEQAARLTAPPAADHPVAEALAHRAPRTSGSRVEVVHDLVARQRRRAAAPRTRQRLGLARPDAARSGRGTGARPAPPRCA